jgi:hypothetical protein
VRKFTVPGSQLSISILILLLRIENRLTASKTFFPIQESAPGESQMRIRAIRISATSVPQPAIRDEMDVGALAAIGSTWFGASKAMIRQAISCDVCGAEKRQTNHWFVAFSHGGELRVTGWNASGRMRAGSKHLCGQTCLHKLLDDFIAGTMQARTPQATEASEREEPIAATDGSLTSAAAYSKTSSAVSIPTPIARPSQVVPASIAAPTPSRDGLQGRAMDGASAAIDDPPSYGSRRWRAEAWERERERCSAGTTHRKMS